MSCSRERIKKIVGYIKLRKTNKLTEISVTSPKLNDAHLNLLEENLVINFIPNEFIDGIYIALSLILLEGVEKKLIY